LCAPFFFSAHLLSCGVSGFVGEALFGSCSPVVRTLLVVRAAPCFGFDAPFGLCAPFSLAPTCSRAACRGL